MRILMTTDTESSIWSYALELTKALQPYAIYVHLATMGEPPTSDQWREANAISNLTVYPSSFKLEWMDDAWVDVWAAGDWLQDLAATIKPDLIHLNSYAHAGLSWNAPVIVAGHSCMLSWWRAVNGSDAPPSWAEYRQHVETGLERAAAVVTPTYSMLRCLDDLYGRVLNGCVIHPARSNSAFKPAAKWDFVFCGGRTGDNAINLSMMAETAADTDLPILIAGNLNMDDDRKTRAHLLGSLKERETAYWMSRARIYAHPVYYEPFGLSILEAAQSGCALILSDIDSLRELWDGAAMFLPPDDPNAWSSVIDRLADHPTRAAAWGDAALNRARQFTPERMAEGYLGVYNSLRLTDERNHVPLDHALQFMPLRTPRLQPVAING